MADQRPGTERETPGTEGEAFGTEGEAFGAERASLVAYGRRMVADGLVDGMSGNLSVRAAGSDLVAITPSGISYDDISPADICLVRLTDGGTDSAGKPSTETPMHLAIYRVTGAGAVAHTHSPFVVALSAVLDVLPAVHYAMADLGGPVRVAPYARFGTDQLAGNAVAALADRTAVILQNHGALTYGRTIAQAYGRARTLEWLARTYWHAWMVAGERTLRLLDEAALNEVREATRAIGYGEGRQTGQPRRSRADPSDG
jgi:L-fuculose-phosphate aldolase